MVVLCSYPKCEKIGHTVRKKEQKKAKLKRAGRSRDFKKKSSKNFQSRLPARGRGACYVCGSKEHRALNVLAGHTQMTEKRRKAAQRELHLKQVSPLRNRRLVLTGIDIQDERSEIQRMKTQMKLKYQSLSYNNDYKDNTAEDDEYVYLDSCALKRLIILCDQLCLESFVYSGGSMQTTRAMVQLNCLGPANLEIG